MLYYFCDIFIVWKRLEKIFREDGFVLNFFRVIFEFGYWIEVIRKKMVKDGILIFGVEVFLDFFLLESNWWGLVLCILYVWFW